MTEKIIYRTKPDAMKYINDMYPDAILTETVLTDSDNADDSELHGLIWSSNEVSAYDVTVDGENVARIGWWEEGDETYRVNAPGICKRFNSLLLARELFRSIVNDARDRNLYAMVTVINERTGETTDIEEVETEDNDTTEELRSLALAHDRRKRIGEKVHKERIAQGMSIRQLAELCRVSKNHITRIENGGYNYTIDTLGTVLNVLGLDIDIKSLNS